MSKKVALVIAHAGYQPVEYSETKTLLESAGVQVVTVSDRAGTAYSKNDLQAAEVDAVIYDIDTADYDGIFFIGGPGALEHLDHEESYTVLREARKHEIAFGAICIASRILAKAGVLQGTQATGWDDDGQLSDIFQEYHVEYIHHDVVVDGNVVTATGPHVASLFAQKILEVI